MKSISRLLILLVFLMAAGVALSSNPVDAPVFSTSDAGQDIPVLMYHKVSPYIHHGGSGLRVTPRRFKQHMNYLKKRGFNTVSLDQVINHWDNGSALPPRPVVVTLDDGYENNFTFAFPILKELGFTATVFLVYDQIGGYNAWDIKRPTQPRTGLLSWEQIREMQDYGISFQSHTLTHPDLIALPPRQAKEEIALSKARLENALGLPVNFIAYPYGRTNEHIRTLVREAGYQAGISTIAGKNNPATDRYRLKRLRIMGHTGLEEFAEMVENQAVILH